MEDKKSTYPIDSGTSAETARLIAQGRIIDIIMGGIFSPGKDLSHITRILDVACGPGEWVLEGAYMYPDKEFYGIDIDPSMIKYAEQSASVQGLTNAHFKVMNINDLDFPDGFFDLVNIRLILAALLPKDYPLFFQRCQRFLRLDGELRWTEANMGSSNSAAYEKYIRIFSHAMYISKRSFSPDGYELGLLTQMPNVIRNIEGFGNIELHLLATEMYPKMPPPSSYTTFKKNIEFLLKLLQPFILQISTTTKEELDDLYDTVMDDMNQPDFNLMTMFLTIHAQKEVIA